LDTGHFFDRDPFSGSHAGERWIPHQWLGEVAMAFLDRAGGFDALLLAAVTLLAATFAPLFARLVRGGLHWLPATMLTGLGLAAHSPAAWPILAFAAVYGVVLLNTRQRPRITWLLPLAWLALGCDRIRHAPLFAVAALVALADILPHTTWAKRLTASGSDLFR